MRSYKIQSDSEPEETWHQVTIDAEKTPAATCDCEDYVCRDQVCEHIERAITCYIYGV
jgi:hypothetical protein